MKRELTTRIIKVDLDKSDLISLVMGSWPEWGSQVHEILCRKGFLMRNIKVWDKAILNKLTEGELFELYQHVKQSNQNTANHE